MTADLPDRRAAVAELGAELRALADLVTRTEVGVGVLRDSARRLREVAPALREPLYGYGGVSAMLVDQLLGHAAAASGHSGVTTELTVRHRRPVPLDAPLRIWAA